MYNKYIMDNNVTPNPKCNRCHCYWKPDDTDIKSSGLVCKTCKRCRDNSKVHCKKYREENPDKGKESNKKYRENTKCEHGKRYGECKICNLPLYLIKIQRGQVWRCLNNSSQNKTKHSIEYLGCDPEYFIEYFQKKMDVYNETADIKMEWNNIHIDHIKPISSFNLDDEEEFLDCCNYTNMQPLLAKDNLSKTDKWCFECDEYWHDNIKGKEYMPIYIPMV